MVIDCKSIADGILDDVKLTAKQFMLYPRMEVILVGDDKSSQVYVRNKEKDCELCGFSCNTHILPKEFTDSSIVVKLNQINSDEVDGILVQLPLPSHVDKTKILECIPSEKDVDGLTYDNVGRLRYDTTPLKPCTPSGIMKILESLDIEIEGSNFVIVGRSDIVGKPLIEMALNKNATVTVCHSKTKNLGEITKTADILVVAVGKEKFITADMVKEGSVVIDVGINRDKNGKLCGDVDFENVKNKAGYITPVPGGVGLVTRAMLMKNLLSASLLRRGNY